MFSRILCNLDVRQLEEWQEVKQQDETNIANALVQALEEYADQSKDIQMMPMAANGETVWKDYGNRYFTAKATVTTAAGSGWVSLENHYTLSANGIDERYGNANAKAPTATGTKIEIDVLGISIADSSARTIGASDVNMHAEYLMRGTGGSAGLAQKTIKLETAVGYAAHNKTTKQIQVKHSWNLK